MKKILPILVLSLLAVCISFSVFVQGGQALAIGGPTIHQEEDYWKEKYEELAYFIENEVLPELRSLRKEFDNMKSKLESVEADYMVLEANYAVLEVEYKLAKSQLETRTTMMYVFIVTTVVFVATTLYLALRRPKAGT